MSVVPHYVLPVAATANGIFAGLGLTINAVTVPALRAGGYPASSWAVTYKNGSKIGIATIIISSFAHFYTYHLTKNHRSLCCGILSLISFPYTIIFMKPTNDRLHALNAQLSPDQKEVVQLVEKWDKLQMFRTAAGTLAFVLTVFY
ncbi:hypothetical protein BDA99DRAFT_516883 [Phascolomyces articulosus]|uniref:DUF1772-domain-containing protein n=1 Tax=Phascolomyces articulosus TaxID=60185 RepID=A0AAD5K588_9FUNG|nr:hypothetical protein BDA99DRAFT_516883 [Phascolomyces articulosus]